LFKASTLLIPTISASCAAKFNITKLQYTEWHTSHKEITLYVQQNRKYKADMVALISWCKQYFPKGGIGREIYNMGLVAWVTFSDSNYYAFKSQNAFFPHLESG